MSTQRNLLDGGVQIPHEKGQFYGGFAQDQIWMTAKVDAAVCQFILDICLHIHCVSKKTIHQTLAHNFPKC